jgi:hypothetical protein
MKHTNKRKATTREAASESSPFIGTVARTVDNRGIANAGCSAEQVHKKSRISSFEDFTSPYRTLKLSELSSMIGDRKIKTVAESLG